MNGKLNRQFYRSYKKAKLSKLFYRLFKKAIKGKYDYVHIVNPSVTQENYFRGIGKTVVLIKLANKYNLPIYYRFFSTMSHIRTVCKELGLKMPIMHYKADKNGGSIRGQRMILIDEDMSIEDIKKLQSENPMVKIIGFARINSKK